MAQLHINVTADAIRTLESMSRCLHDLNTQMVNELSKLHREFEDNASGLGPHANEILLLLEELEDISGKAGQANRKLAQKAARAAVIRRGLLDQNPYANIKNTPDDAYIPEVLGRIYDNLIRQRIRPKVLGPSKEVRGTWKGQIFYASNDFIPKKHNPGKLNFGQIRQSLSKNYGITFDGISYENGYGDFRPVAVAQLGIHEIIAVREAEDGYVNFDTVFNDRDRNFKIADQLAASRKLPIPDLPAGYTANDLTQWRKEQQFSWEESYTNGYLLVPSVVHGNLAHTGLVSVSAHGTEAEKAFAKRHGGNI